MKLLLVSIPSIHFFRWTAQLEKAGFDVHWFDISGSGQYNTQLSWVTQHVSWKLRYDYPGRTFVKKHLAWLYKILQRVNERSVATEFEKVLHQVQPDAVHSFALYVSCTPIFSVMKKYTNIPWIYSSWGSDLFYFQHIPSYKKDIERILPSIDYMFSDCKRDVALAKALGFKGTVLGVFPGGGGFDIATLQANLVPIEKRTVILIKGYEGRSGRAIPVLKAILQLKDVLESFRIVVFGATQPVIDFVASNTFAKQRMEVCPHIQREQLLSLLQQSLLYIGNSNSDGMPNTLLEAMGAGAFPIQSNPGGATAEVITNGTNGLLIEDCEDVEEITTAIKKAFSENVFSSAQEFNLNFIKNNFSYHTIATDVVKAYQSIFQK